MKVSKEEGRWLLPWNSWQHVQGHLCWKRKASFSDVLCYHSFWKKKILSVHSQVSPAGSKRPRHRRSTQEHETSGLLEAIAYAHICKSAAYKYASTFDLLSSSCGVSVAGGCRSSSGPWDLHTPCAVGILHFKLRSGVTLGSLSVIHSRLSQDSEARGIVIMARQRAFLSQTLF